MPHFRARKVGFGHIDVSLVGIGEGLAAVDERTYLLQRYPSPDSENRSAKARALLSRLRP